MIFGLRINLKVSGHSHSPLEPVPLPRGREVRGMAAYVMDPGRGKVYGADGVEALRVSLVEVRVEAAAWLTCSKSFHSSFYSFMKRKEANIGS